MNRKETTAFLSELLKVRCSGIGKYYASEVTIDWGSKNERRIDFLEFDPLNQFSVSGLEKGVFTCYEVKSCKEDVFSGNGLNFIGEKNYIVTTMQCWKDIQEKYRNGELRDHIKSLSPDNSDYWGILVAVPNYRDIQDEFYDVTPLEDGILSIALAGFLRNISTLLVMDAGQRLMQDHPELTIGQEKHGGKGKGDSLITMGDIITVMHGEDLIRHIGQFTQLQDFISWFLNQNEPDDDIWYDMNFLVDKWNQYAEIKKG